LKRSLLVCGVALGTAFGVHAQQNTAGNTPDTASAKSSKQQAGQGQMRSMLASRLIGMTVQGAQGNKLGEVEDLAVDVKSGQVRYAVLAFDPGFLSAERLVPVPVKELRAAPEGDRLVYQKASKEQLEKRAVKRSDWNDAFVGNAQRIAALDESWGLPKSSGGTLMRANNLLDKEVQNKSGENIGEIEDLVIDMGRQQVHYAMLEFERSWLKPEKTVAVPLSAFSRPASGGDELVMDVNQAKVKDMKGLTAEQRRNPDDPEVIAVIERHIVFLEPAASTAGAGGGSGATPDTRASGAGSGGQGTGSSDSSSPQQSQEQKQKQK
jgi:sporulation protein YlmC with PRC-barrel domain